MMDSSIRKARSGICGARFKRGGVKSAEVGGGDFAWIKLGGPLGGGFFGEFGDIGFFEAAVGE